MPIYDYFTLDNYYDKHHNHIISGKVVTFQESLFACKRKLSKTSRLLRRAATGNCPDHLGWVTARLTIGQLPVAARRRRRDIFESLRLQANKDS